MKVEVIGFDPGFSNFGYVNAQVDTDTLVVEPYRIGLINTKKDSTRGVRVSTDDLRRCRELHDEMSKVAWGANLIISEVPSGGAKSYAAGKAMSYSLCLLACTGEIPLIQVSARDVKLAAVSDPFASKEQMIDWARETYPHLEWTKAKSRNEHMADAIASVHAGVQTVEFLDFTEAANDPHVFPLAA